MKTVEDYNTRYKYLEQLKESGKLYIRGDREDIRNISVGDYVRLNALRNYHGGLVKSVDKVKGKLTYVSPKTTEDHLGNKTTKLVSKTAFFSDITKFASDKPASEENLEKYDTEKRIFTEITERPFSNLEMDVLLSDVHRIKVIHERGELNLNVESGIPNGGTFYSLYKAFHGEFYNSPYTKLAREFISKLKKYLSTFDKTEKYWVETNDDENMNYVLTIYLFDPRKQMKKIGKEYAAYIIKKGSAFAVVYKDGNDIIIPKQKYFGRTTTISLNSWPYHIYDKLQDYGRVYFWVLKEEIFVKEIIPLLLKENFIVKSLYELTWEEYAQTVYISSGQKEAIQNAWAKVVKPTNKKDYNQLLEEWWEANNPHRKLVLKAYSEGKPVPTHILKFYKIMKNNILSGLQGFGFVPGLPSVIKVGDKVYSTNSTTIYTVGAAAWQTGAPIGTTPLTKITEAGKYIGKVRSIKGDVITLDYDKPRFVKYSEVQKEGTPGGAPNPNVPAPFGPGTTEPPKPETDTNANTTGSSMKKYLPLALAAAAGLALYSMSSGGSGRRKKKRSGLFGTYHGRNGVKTIPVKIGNQTMKIHLKTTEVK